MILEICITPGNVQKLNRLVELEFGSYSPLNRDKWMNRFLDNLAIGTLDVKNRRLQHET